MLFSEEVLQLFFQRNKILILLNILLSVNLSETFLLKLNVSSWEKCTDVHGLIGNLLREEVTGEIVLQVKDRLFKALFECHQFLDLGLGMRMSHMDLLSSVPHCPVNSELLIL